MHYCYILYNNANMRTYVGYTVDPVRRLRQHNGYLVGGARYTKQCKGEWSFLAVITCPTFTSHLGLSLEWHIKRNRHIKHNRHNGPSGRITSLLNTLTFNTKFQNMEYHLYVSKYGQSIMTNHMMTELLQLENIIVYGELDDIL
jgi:predicted GIY-YIG superfamily endonuclease